MNNESLPALYTAADKAALGAQRAFYGALSTNLILLTVVAALSVVNIADSRFAAAQLLCLLMTLGLSIYLSISKRQKIWYGTRALAESVKTISWRYSMRAEPFHGPDNAARSEFLTSLRKILRSNEEISGHAVEMSNSGQITAEMQNCRDLSLDERKLIYNLQRIEDQRLWYARKAKFNRDRGNLIFFILIVVNFGAILVAIGRIVSPEFLYWPTDALVAGAGGILAWIQSKRFQELGASYALTAHEIGLLQAEMPIDDDENVFSSFVGDAENAFSREHTQWQARKDTE